MPEWFKNAFNTENLKRRNDDVIEESNQSKRQKHNELKSVFSKETIFKNGEELNDVHYFFDSPMSPQWFNRYLPSSLISSICLDKFSQFKSLAYPFNSYYASGLHANNFQPTSSFHYVSISPSSQWGSYDNKHPVSFIPLSDLSAQKQHSQIPLTGNNTFAKAPIHCENSIFPWLRNEIPEYESQEQESFDRFLTAFQKPFWTVQVSI
ncbi:hypothetical protein HMI55_005831 [Coelomomyces lativittatus]|nr:hypothetical protein HMI55_005831 [Coelomomyces lativittatus]